MKNGLRILGIIGARSGSKGLPDKNIRFLAGKPLMGWIIEKVKKSKYINRVIVSTDSEQYADLARSLGAETPFLRPKEFAEDYSTDFDYIQHALEYLKSNEDYVPDFIVRLMPTAPFQKTEDIDRAIEKLINDRKADSCVIVAKASQHPAKALKIDNDGLLTGYMGGSAEPTPRQKHEPAYFRANVVITKLNTVLNTRSLTGGRCLPYVISDPGVDIDSLTDFYIAEQLMERLNEK